MAGGYTMSLPQQDRSYKCRGEMLEDIQVLLGGRVAEALTLEDISTGASNDIERATDIARRMVTKFGMSDNLGPICYASSDGDEVFLGRDFGHTRNHSEEIAAKIDAEVHRMLSESYALTEQKLSQHMDKLVAVAERLMVTEKMDGDEFRAIMENENIAE
jgi:cell division protease FtsH